jgi:hypothetical protein
VKDSENQHNKAARRRKHNLQYPSILKLFSLPQSNIDCTIKPTLQEWAVLCFDFQSSEAQARIVVCDSTALGDSMVPSSLPVDVTLKLLPKYLLSTEGTIAEKLNVRAQNTAYKNYLTENEKLALRLTEFESTTDGHEKTYFQTRPTTTLLDSVYVYILYNELV